ncbi:MAG: DUF4258 domain-containing protein [Archaeoglobaceae archaeon]
MRIIISEHAKKRAEERGIGLELINNVLESPEGLANVKFGRKIAYKKIEEKYVVVIFEEQKDEIVVVTTLKVDRERLKRYGIG